MTKVKICGNTRPGDAELACELEADMVGVIVDVSVSTPREVSLGTAREVLGSVPVCVSTVVVTMPEGPGEAVGISEELEPDYLQVHDNLPISDLEEIKSDSGSGLVGVSKVPRDPEGPDGVISRAEKVAEVSDVLLLDTDNGSGGGTGEVHSWDLSRRIIESLDSPVILAGGLNPVNVGVAVREVGPWGVDVASGVESGPGEKDENLLKEFVTKAKGEES